MSDVKSYVAFKKKAICAMHHIDGGTFSTSRSGSWWSAMIAGEWASVSARYHPGHPMTVEEFCRDLEATWEAESWNNAHC